MRRQVGRTLAAVVHYLTAFVLLMKGVSKLDHPEGYWPFIVLCLVSALAIAAATVFHRRLHHWLPRAEVGIYGLESMVCGAVAYLTAREGKVGLPFAWWAACGLFVLAAIVRGSRPERD